MASDNEFISRHGSDIYIDSIDEFDNFNVSFHYAAAESRLHTSKCSYFLNKQFSKTLKCLCAGLCQLV